MPAPVSEDEALLRWAEERLEGQYEPCTDCDSKGWVNDGSGRPCGSCYGEGRIPRWWYLQAERALTQAQREEVGENGLVERTTSSIVSMFELED